MPKLLGAHTIDNGGIHMAVKRAASAGMTAMQLFTAIPKFYGDKQPIKPERVARFKTALAASRIKPTSVVVHAAYVLSVATPDDESGREPARGSRRRWSVRRRSALAPSAFTRDRRARASVPRP